MRSGAGRDTDPYSRPFRRRIRETIRSSIGDITQVFPGHQAEKVRRRPLRGKGPRQAQARVREDLSHQPGGAVDGPLASAARLRQVPRGDGEGLRETRAIGIRDLGAQLTTAGRHEIEPKIRVLADRDVGLGGEHGLAPGHPQAV